MFLLQEIYPRYLTDCGPLHKLTRKDHKFNWTDKCQSSFEPLKEKLITAPILAYVCKQYKIQNWEELHVCAVNSAWDEKLKNDEEPSELNDIDKPDEQNTSDWRKGQLEDPIIGCFLRVKQNEESKESWKDISHESQEFKTYWALCDQLDVCEGILYKMHEDSTTQEMVRQTIFPSGMRKDILHFLHEGPTNGHLGVAKTLAKLRNRYY